MGGSYETLGRERGGYETPEGKEILGWERSGGERRSEGKLGAMRVWEIHVGLEKKGKGRGR